MRGCRQTLGLWCLFAVAACEPAPSSQGAYTPSEYHAISSASSEYRREVDSVGVYQGLYENEDAIRHYCGGGKGVTDADAWLAACNRKLERVYWARVRTQYRYADMQEVTDYCDLKPDACATPKGLDDAIRGAHISGAQHRNHQQAEQIDEQREQRLAAEKAAEQRFVRALSCSDAAGGACQAQMTARCEAQLQVLGKVSLSADEGGVSADASAEASLTAKCEGVTIP